MHADDLYGLPLDRFIAERGTLVRALRADKRRDEAVAVAALRKPSVAAWAVNQLVRSQRAAVKDLFAAGDALGQAQADLLAGRGDGRALRSAGERERAAVDGLVEAARGLLSSAGQELSAAVVDRVLDTLHAAALDPDAREHVRTGRLERELRHAGLGLGESTAAAAPRPARAKPAGESEDTGREAAERKRERRRLAAEQERAEREQAAADRKAARLAESEARRRAQRAESALQAAQERRERAAHALGEADAALAQARAEAGDAATALRRAQADLER